jgi:hypothetical protein
MSRGEPIYTFIHIPKCGGTSVEKYFETHYSDRIIGTTHKWLCEKDNNPIVIIRNPFDRFISLYHYWKNGSHGRNSRGTEFTEKYGNCSIKEFIKIFQRNTDAIKNNYMHELVTGYMWRIHYFPQVYWIHPDFFENAIVIKYTENLDEKIHALLDYLHIPDKCIELERSNVTRTKEGEQAVLDEEDILWLREHFREDFELWDAANETPERFKYVL